MFPSASLWELPRPHGHHPLQVPKAMRTYCRILTILPVSRLFPLLCILIIFLLASSIFSLIKILLFLVLSCLKFSSAYAAVTQIHFWLSEALCTRSQVRGWLAVFSPFGNPQDVGPFPSRSPQPGGSRHSLSSHGTH